MTTFVTNQVLLPPLENLFNPIRVALTPDVTEEDYTQYFQDVLDEYDVKNDKTN